LNKPSNAGEFPKTVIEQGAGLTFHLLSIELVMKKMATTLLLLSAFAIISCAHKEPPLSKDRLSPRLLKVLALNNRQIQFTFSEEIDTLSLKPENFAITSDTDTLEIMALNHSLSLSEILALTEIQFDKKYDVSGYVFDTAQNKGNFKKTFSGSTNPDTIKPWVVKYSKGERHAYFNITFSEAMDTTFMNFYILPKKDLKSSWQNYLTCKFIPHTATDSLKSDTTYYLFIDRGARDVSGNTVGAFITSITPDTSYKPFILKGKVLLNDTLIKTGIVILRRENPLGISLIRSGNFSFEVRDTNAYMVDAISDKYSGSAEALADSENIIILELEEKNIDSLIN